MSYGHKWRTYRTMVHQLLSFKSTLTFVPSQEYEIKQLMFELAKDNENEENFYFNVRRMSMSIISTSTLGRRIDSRNHIDIQRSAESSRLLGRISRAGAFIEDELPLLLLLPRWLQPSYRKATDYAKLLLNAKLHIWNRLKREHESGSLATSFGKDLLESEYGSKGLTEADAAWIVGGKCTTEARISLFFELHSNNLPW
jgi:cytochrome P450